VITEVAINPCVFDKGCYSHESLCRHCIGNLWAALERDAMARDLREGDWAKHVIAQARGGALETTARHMVQTLRKKNRFTVAPSELPSEPPDYDAWCEEAKLSDARSDLAGIIVSEAGLANHNAHPKVKSVEKLNKVSWWQDRSLSAKTARSTAAYLRALGTVLTCAKYLMFVDAFLDPKKPRYADFVSILRAAKRATGPQPKIEIHRVIYEGSGPARRIIKKEELEGHFRAALESEIKALVLQVEVFIWDDYHDRYLLSDVIGLSVSNGFDVDGAPNARMVFTRLSEKDNRSTLEEYHPEQTTLRSIQHRFVLG
jgi:hypothetical protein